MIVGVRCAPGTAELWSWFAGCLLGGMMYGDVQASSTAGLCGTLVGVGVGVILESAVFDDTLGSGLIGSNLGYTLISGTLRGALMVFVEAERYENISVIQLGSCHGGK